MWFHPVNNTRGHRDPIVVQLMRSIEEVARGQEYIKKKVGHFVRVSIEMFISCISSRCHLDGCV